MRVNGFLAAPSRPLTTRDNCASTNIKFWQTKPKIALAGAPFFTLGARTFVVTHSDFLKCTYYSWHHIPFEFELKHSMW